MSNTVSETALMKLNVLSKLCSLDQYQRLVIISSIYHVKYSVRNSLDKLEGTQLFIPTAQGWEMSSSRNIALINIKDLS